MTEKEFEFYYALYYVKLRVIQRIARKLALNDEELGQDLIQEGLMRLSRLNPEKANINTDAWIRQSIKFAMVDYLRKNNPQQYESLDIRLANGDQLEQDETTGDLRLISLRHDSRNAEQSRDVDLYMKRLECEDDLYD